MAVRTPDFKFTLGVFDFSSLELRRRVKSIEVELLSDAPSSFKIILDDADELFSKAVKGKINEGDKCTISLGFVETGLNQVIEGKITGVKGFKKDSARRTFEVTGFDDLQLLTRGRKRRSWENIKDSDIAGIIADECGLGRNFDDSGIVQPFVVQNNISNLAFLYERARRIGFEVKVVGRDLVFKKPEKADTGVTLRLDATKAGGNTQILKTCDFDTSTMNVVDKVVVRSYDPDSAKPIIASSSNVNGGSMGGSNTGAVKSTIANTGTTIQVSDQPVYSEEEAEKLAESILNQRADNFMTGKGSCEGNSTLRCGSIVKILDIGSELEGDYYLTEVKHELKAGHGDGFGYWTSFTVSRTGR